jgi:hypothetical protein
MPGNVTALDYLYGAPASSTASAPVLSHLATNFNYLDDFLDDIPVSTQ